MRKLLLAVVACVGLGLAASPTLAAHGRHGHGGHYGHGHQGHGHWDRHYDHYHYHVPRGCYGPRVYYNTPGFYYSGRNLSFGVGF